MFQSNSKFSKSERRMARHEFINGTTYYTEAQVMQNKSGSDELLRALPKQMDKEKLEEALNIFEATPKE